MATKKEDKPLFAPVTVQSPWKSGNAIQNLTLDGSQTQQSTQGDASMTWDQVQQAQHDPRPLSETGKVPGSGEVKLNDTARNMGVWEGSPEALTYDRMLAEMRRRHPAESVEERRERLKRQRRNNLFAALGDGISALSNLYFTTKGSPSADQSKTMSKALRDAYDKADKDREAEERSNLNTMLQVMNQQRLAHSAWLARKNQAELIELRKKAAEAGNVAAMKRIDELRRYHTELAQIERENKKAEQERKDQEAEQRKKESEERIANNRRRTQIYGSGVANQNANRNASTADKAKHNRQVEAQGWARVRKSGRGGNQPFSHTRTITGYENGKKVVDTYKDHGTSQPKKKLRKNNMGL